MNRLLCVFLCAALPAIAAGDEAFDHSHDSLTQILSRNVEEGLVDYSSLAEEPAELASYLDTLAGVPREQFESWTKDQQLAFLINLYNAATLKLIADEYPVDSIKELGAFASGPFDKPLVELFGKARSLDYIEHELIRKQFDEPRIHFALVCAALSCPPLRPEAYTAPRMDQQLQQQAERFLSETNKNYVNENGNLRVSPIFDWFRDDFTSEDTSLTDYVRSHLPKDEAARLAEDPEVGFTYYNWALNEKGAAVSDRAPTGFRAWLLGGLQTINYLGAIGILAYIIGYVALALAFMSGALMTMAGGFLFGAFWGVVWVSIASTSAAALAFLIGRYLARGAIEKKIEGNEKFSAIDSAVAEEGWKIVLLTRLSPIFPYVFLNYAYGLTKVRFWHYVLASWIGMLPGTVVYVWMGSLAENLATLAAGGSGEKTPAQWALTIVGFGAAVAVTFYVTKIARRALRDRIDDKDDESGAEDAPGQA